MTLLCLINFLASFLLFQLELIVAKLVLPLYGGSYAVWGACVVFFQALLLLGYLYVHWAASNFPRSYFRWHIVLFFVPLLVFPGRALVLSAPTSTLPLVVNVFGKLLATIGPVFFVLSTVSVFFQRWLISSVNMRYDPYRLYAYSNLGAFAALLSYPVLFEYHFDLGIQQIIWRWSYTGFVFLSAVAYVAILLKEKTLETGKEDQEKISGFEWTRWLLLGAAGSMIFLAATNILTYEVAPIPLFWTIPLSIYFFSFVLNFKKEPWCPRWVNTKIHIILAFAVMLFLFIQRKTFPFLIEFFSLCTVLFLLCMYCQNQLILHKAKTQSGLTRFYVTVSLGGFIGGLVVSWFIPLIFSSFVEFPFALFIITLTVLMQEPGIRLKGAEVKEIVYALLVILALLAWPFFFKKYNVVSFVYLVTFICVMFVYLNRYRRSLVLAMAFFIVFLPRLEELWSDQVDTIRRRNYYGVYDIERKGALKMLSHGMVIHGLQYVEFPHSRIPLSYYGYTSGVGELLRDERLPWKDTAAIGLGVGTIAAYAGPSQTIDFFELDPDVYSIAKTHFGYLGMAAGEVNVFIGDARLQLERSAKRYDFIISDAFSGDSVPFHLLTVEMMNEYRAHLKERGVVAFHITNRYLDLWPVLARTASEAGAKSCIKFFKGKGAVLDSLWLAMTWDEDTFSHLISELRWQEARRETVENYRPWTDDYSNVFKIFKLNELVNDVKNFRYFSTH